MAGFCPSGRLGSSARNSGPYTGSRSRKIPTALMTAQPTIAKAFGNAAVRERFFELGAEPQAMSPDEFARFLRDTHAKLGKVIAAANIKVD